MKPMVVMPHTETGLMPQAWAALIGQYPDAMHVVTSCRNPFDYADLVRQLWRRDGDLIICEGDTVPPPGAIAGLLSCPDEWCTHPHWMGDHYGLESFGLVRFSHELRRTAPLLADLELSRPDPRYWVRRGWTGIPRDCSPSVLNSKGRVATLRHDAPPDAQRPDPRSRPSTHDWCGIDTTLARALRALRVDPHTHLAPTRHLHDYELWPPGSRLPWHQRPYVPEEWPL